jgi:nidogen (entactin)
MLDGRAYTAISKISQSIGYDMQSLQILGGVIGWVFAKPNGDVVNGYHLTGGIFNHTVTINFTDTNQQIILRQKYLGLDVFDQLKLESDLQGDIPQLPIDSRVTVADYEEHYTLTAPNVIQSSSKRNFKYSNFLDGSEIVVPYTVDQSFIYDSCKFKVEPIGTSWKIKVGKNFISYEAKEQVIRFGLSTKVTPLGGVRDVIMYNIVLTIFF